MTVCILCVDLDGGCMTVCRPCSQPPALMYYYGGVITILTLTVLTTWSLLACL